MPEANGSATQPYDDPGWFRGASTPAGRSSSPGTDGVGVLRWLFLSLLMAPFLILMVLTIVIDEMGSLDPVLAIGIAILAIAGVAAAGWASRRDLDVTDPSTLAASYNTNFFLGFALNEAPLLMAFVVCFIRDELWPYLVAFPLYLVGMWLLAPTKRNLQRRQEQVHRQGSMLSLGRALAGQRSSATE